MEEEKKIILNLLLDKLFDEYKAENARKDTLESNIISLRFRHGGEKITNLC